MLGGRGCIMEESKLLEGGLLRLLYCTKESSGAQKGRVRLEHSGLYGGKRGGGTNVVCKGNWSETSRGGGRSRQRRARKGRDWVWLKCTWETGFRLIRGRRLVGGGGSPKEVQFTEAVTTINRGRRGETF